MGEATDDDAGKWAARAIGNNMASFSLNKFGEELAGALAGFWADRMEFMYSCHLEGRLAGGILTPELREHMPQPTLVVELLARLAEHHPGHHRLATIFGIGASLELDWINVIRHLLQCIPWLVKPLLP